MRRLTSTDKAFARIIGTTLLAFSSLTLLFATTLEASPRIYISQVDIAATATALAQLQHAIFATQTAIAATTIVSAPIATPTPRPTATPTLTSTTPRTLLSTATRTLAATPTVRPISRTVAPMATVLVEGLNVRMGPGTGYTIIGSLSIGQQVQVTGQAGDCAWLQVVLPSGSEAWISGAAVFTQLSTSCSAVAAVVTPTPSAANSRQGGATGQLVAAPILVSPDDNAHHAYSRLRFSWKWPGQLRANWGFEVRGWGEGGPHNGLHDARATAGIKPDGNGVYSFELTIPSNFTYADWKWSVAVVQLDPYLRIGAEAAPRRLFVDTRTPTPVLVPAITPVGRP